MALIVKPKFANLQQLPTLKNNILNAYCKFTYQKQHLTSKVKFNSSKNPDWDAVLSFKNINPQGIIWVEIYHQQPPYDVLIAASYISIKSLKLKPSVAKPETIDLLSTKQVKVGTITVMFQYIPSDQELEGGISVLYNSVIQINSSQTYPLNTNNNNNKVEEKKKEQSPPKKYSTGINFTESNMFLEKQKSKDKKEIKKWELQEPRVIKQKQYLLPQGNKNNPSFNENLSFGPMSQGYTFANYPTSQNFSPQPSYQGSFQGYEMNMNGHPYAPVEMRNQNNVAPQFYQPPQSYPKVNYKKQKGYPTNQNVKNQYSYSDLLPNNPHYQQNYNNYNNQQQYPNAMGDYNNNKNYTPRQNPSPANYPPTQNPKPTQNQPTPANHYGYYQPQPQPLARKGSVDQLHPKQKQPQPQPHSPQLPARNKNPNHPPIPKPNLNKTSPQKPIPTPPPLTTKQYEALMYHKMQQVLKKKEQDDLVEEMIKKYYNK